MRWPRSSALFGLIPILLAIAFASFLWLVVIPDGRAARAADRVNVISSSVMPWGHIHTVRHGRHQWIVTGSGAAIAHDPDCPSPSHRP